MLFHRLLICVLCRSDLPLHFLVRAIAHEVSLLDKDNLGRPATVTETELDTGVTNILDVRVNGTQGYTPTDPYCRATLIHWHQTQSYSASKHKQHCVRLFHELRTLVSG